MKKHFTVLNDEEYQHLRRQWFRRRLVNWGVVLLVVGFIVLAWYDLGR